MFSGCHSSGRFLDSSVTWRLWFSPAVGGSQLRVTDPWSPWWPQGSLRLVSGLKSGRFPGQDAGLGGLFLNEDEASGFPVPSGQLCPRDVLPSGPVLLGRGVEVPEGLASPQVMPLYLLTP